MTKIDAIQAVINGEITDEVIAKMNEMLATEQKRAGSVRKPTPQQLLNADTKVAIVGEMVKDTFYTVAEICKFACIPADTSNQRVTALMRQLVAEGFVVKTEEKRKTFYSLA